MKHFFRQKHPYLAIILVFAVMMLLGVAQLGSSVNPVPKEMPVILVQNDQGAKLPNGQQMNYGKLIGDKVTGFKPQSGDESAPLLWDNVKTEKDALDAMNHEKAYATVMIPADFTEKLSSLMSPQPQNPEITVYVNQGMNYTGANMVNQILSQMLTGASSQIRDQMLGQLNQKGGTLNVDQAKAFANPIVINTKNINAVGSHSSNGNAPVVLTQLVWFGAMASTIVLFMAAGKATQSGSSLHRLSIRFSQIVMGAVTTAIASLSILLITGGWLGLSIPDYTGIGLFLFFAGFMFFLIQTAVISWLGFAGMPLFILVFFFGLPILTLPAELLPQFSRDWLYSWIPLRFSVEGLRDLFYFRQGLNLSDSEWTLGILGAVGLVLTLCSVLKQSKPKQQVAAELAQPSGV